MIYELLTIPVFTTIKSQH